MCEHTDGYRDARMKWKSAIESEESRKGREFYGICVCVCVCTKYEVRGRDGGTLFLHDAHGGPKTALHARVFPASSRVDLAFSALRQFSK